MFFQRTVTYEIEADSLEEAREIWGDSGPEIETWAPIEERDVSDLTEVIEEKN